MICCTRNINLSTINILTALPIFEPRRYLNIIISPQLVSSMFFHRIVVENAFLVVALSVLKVREQFSSNVSVTSKLCSWLYPYSPYFHIFARYPYVLRFFYLRNVIFVVNDGILPMWVINSSLTTSNKLFTKERHLNAAFWKTISENVRSSTRHISDLAEIHEQEWPSLEHSASDDEPGRRWVTLI